MDREDNRARGDRSLSELGGSPFGHVQFSDAPRVCEAKAVGTGVKFRYRIGGTAATDERPHELREQGQTASGQDQMASGAVAPAELDQRRGLSEGAMTFGTGRGTSPGLALASDGRQAKWKNDRR